MAIRWKNVKIIDKSGKVHPGFKARTFIQDNCPDTISNIETKGFEDVVRVKLSDGTTSLDLNKIKDVLKSALDKIGAGLEISDGKTWSVVSFPVAKKVQNVLNIIQPKLKVEFIYKHDSRAKTKKYLEDPVIAVTAAFAGNAHQPAAQNKKDAPKGIADYGTVLVGKYTLTPDYSKLEKCKFDFDGKPIDIVLGPGDDKIVTFEVEPLYQKVQLIAHCLLAIPDRTYEPAINETLVANPKYGVEPDQAPKKVVDATIKWKDIKITDKDSVVHVESEAQKFVQSNCPDAISNIETKGFEDIVRVKLSNGTTSLDLQDIKDVLTSALGKIGASLTDITQLTRDIAADALKGQWKGKYHGKIKDKEDIEARVNLVKATMDVAYTKAKDDPTILKVFMIPECYFQGLYGSYLIGEPEKGKVDDNHIDGSYLFNKLLDLAGGVQWRDWMFVFGTVNLSFGKGIREMMNYSPVIRGGLGGSATAKAIHSGGETDPQLRLIQKLVNSAELLDAKELIKKGVETREPSVNDAVQFQATENEEEFGKILSRLFDGSELEETKKKIEEAENKTDSELGGKKATILEDLKKLKEELENALKFGETKGLQSEQWKQLKEELDKNVKELGLTRVVRFIRKCSTKGAPDSLPGWGEYSGYKDETQAHLEPESCVEVVWQGLLLKFIKDGWDRYYVAHPVAKPPTPAFNAMRWKSAAPPGPARRIEILTDIQKRLDELLEQFGINLSYQKEILRSKITEFLSDDLAASSFGDSKPAAIPENFGASIYPIWKKIFELYRAEKLYDEELLSQSLKNLDYRDFCFVAARKAGPLLTFDQAEKLESCKKLVFGLEICADHANGRLFNLVQENLPPVLAGEIRKELEMIKDDNNPDTKAEREKKNAEIVAENLKIRNENRPLIENKRKIKEVQDRNDKKPKVTVDIQLVPSAGMIPNDNAIVARRGGYCFNCDGWNKGVGTGVKLITAWFDGIEAKNVSPVTPHTAIAKGGGVPLEIGSFGLVDPNPIKLETVIDSALGKDILNQNGMGELHIYNELDLPKD